jgi:hypothetical protein
VMMNVDHRSKSPVTGNVKVLALELEKSTTG